MSAIPPAGPVLPGPLPWAVVPVALAGVLALACPGTLPAQPSSGPPAGVGPMPADPAFAGPGRTLAPGTRPPAWFRAGLWRSVRLDEDAGRPGRRATEADRPLRGRTRARSRAGPGPGRFPRPGAPAGESAATAPELAAGGLLGGTLGFAAMGLGLTRLLCAGEGRGDVHADCITTGTIVLGLVGESVGLSTGVHVANDRRGSWLASTAASLGVGFGSFYLAEGSPQGPAAVVLPLGVVAQTVGAGLIEKGTADAD